jgi:acetylornithine deacetylase/succinyl-diaminopimelate desuccinylase-like protein
VIRDGKLYGRGGADDGYAVFGSLAAIRALQEQGVPHARCVVLIEGCEESGSFDLPYYIEHLEARIGTPSLVVCLDAECGNYEQLWCTTSLRGNLVGTLRPRAHRRACIPAAPAASCPPSFRVLRKLLDRVEDALPPTCEPAAAARSVQEVLETDPPYGAEVTFKVSSSLGGWNAPTLEPWLLESMQRASQAAFGRDVMYLGTGGSIPFIGMLAERFPGVQFLVTGVLGPNSNAHGPNEFLHLDCARRLTLAVAQVLADHQARGAAAAVA